MYRVWENYEKASKSNIDYTHFYISTFSLFFIKGLYKSRDEL